MVKIFTRKVLRTISKFEDYFDLDERYIVKEVETLPSFAFKFYHDGDLWPLIWLYNVKVQEKYFRKNNLISPLF